MRISAIRIQNYLSFEEFEWLEINPSANFLAGPNGAGKTNIYRALRFLFASLAESTSAESLEQLGHWQSSERPTRVEADIDFTGEREKDLLRYYLASVITDRAQASDVGGVDGRVSHYLLDKFTSEHLGPLLSGRLVAEYEFGELRSWYEALPGATPFQWHVRGPSAPFLVIGVTDSPRLGQPFSTLWAAGQTDAERIELAEFLAGRNGHPKPPDLNVSFEEVNAAFTATFNVTRSMPTHRYYLDRSHVNVPQGMWLGSTHLWESLLQESFVFTSNVRVRPVMIVESNWSSGPVADLSDGQHLARYLYEVKNGNRRQREHFEQIQATFRDLTGDNISVGLRQESRVEVDEQRGQELELAVAKGRGDVPLDYSGAGVTEALFLSAVLMDPDRVVLLDEPASNLSPGIQRKLLERLVSGSRAQSIVTTHSPYLIPPDVLSTTYRLYMRDHQSGLARADIQNAPKAYAPTLQFELAHFADARSLLFYDAVLLVEGPTELGALPVWWEKHSGRTLDSQNIAIHDVEGKKGFGRWMWYLSQMHIPWAVICDGDAIGDSPSKCEIAEQIKTATKPSSRLPSTTDDFATRVTILTSYGVYTMNERADGAFESLPVIARNSGAAQSAVGTSKVRRGLWTAENYPCPLEVAKVLEDAVSRVRPS